MAMLVDENADRAILLGSGFRVGAYRFERRAQRHFRGGDRLRKQRVELRDIARLQPGLEVPSILRGRHRQGRNQSRALGKRDPCDQPIRPLGKRGENDNRRFRIIAQVVAAQAGDNGGNLLLEPRQILVPQVAVTGDADHQRQPVG